MKNKKKLYLIIGIIVIVIIVAVGGGKYYTDKRASNYKENLSKAYQAIVYNSSTDINVNKLYAQVLQLTAIEKKSFSQSIKGLGEKDKKTIDDKVDESKKKDEEITVIMKKLKNPINEYKQEYEEIQTIYDAYYKNHLKILKADDKTDYSMDEFKIATDNFKTVSEKSIKMKKLL